MIYYFKSIKFKIENNVPVNIEYKETPKNMIKIENTCSSIDLAAIFP